jgi:hypothetical protein
MTVLRDMIKNEIVTPMLVKRIHATTGTILSYDSEPNTASIEFFNGSGGKSMAYNVPVCIQANGIHTVEPKPGDNVVINFNGGEITSPKITAFYETDYQMKDLAPKTKCGPDVPDFFSYL